MSIRKHDSWSILLAGLLLAHACVLAQMLPEPLRHQPIPFKQDERGLGELAFRSLAGVLVAAAAAYGVVLGLKRLRNGAVSLAGKERLLKPVATLRLGRTSVLHVVEYGGDELLLADSAQGVTLLRSRPLAAGEDGQTHG